MRTAGISFAASHRWSANRLQGYPDGWTDVPGASDSARYKALGNSVAIPCVEYLMQRVAMVITLDLEWDF